MQEKLQRWLSPPHCSINHNNARKAQHDGNGTWFIHCSKFQEWKKNGSLLWISANRTLLAPILTDDTLIFPPILQPEPVKASFGNATFRCSRDMKFMFSISSAIIEDI